MIMIFGASGFLGAALSNHLSTTGKVIAVVRSDSDTSNIDSNVNLTTIREESSEWASLIKSHKPNIVICAQWDGVDIGLRENQEKQFKNVLSIVEIAKAAKSENCQKFIALGSQAESTMSQDLIEEVLLSSGNSWYGKAKSQLADELFEIFFNSKTLMIWARIFSVYGPKDTRKSLIQSLYEARVTRAVVEIREPNRKCSFLHINDFVQAMSAIVNSMNDSGVINVANPTLNQIKDLPGLFGLSNVNLINPEQDFADGYFPQTHKLASLNWFPKISIDVGCKLLIESI